MKKQKVAIFDIDGVLADFEGAFCEAFGNANRHLYSLTSRYPEVDPDLISEWVNDPENYKNLNLIFGGITLLNQLKAKGLKVYLLTSRPEHLTNVTKHWLRIYNIEYYGLMLGCLNKSDTVGRLASILFDVQMFVDDSVKTLQEVRKTSPNIVSLAWAQPWNEGYFPRATYDREKMKVMVNMGDGNWKWIWSKK